METNESPIWNLLTNKLGATAPPGVVRFHDESCGHGCYPRRPNDEASPNVFVNSRGAHRLHDHWMTHCCGIVCHDGRASSGSETVFVNSRPLCRNGDSIDCGGTMCEHSPDVYAGG
jgi:uncharacterized Zn-binding protein involved in type VI secretion